MLSDWTMSDLSLPETLVLPQKGSATAPDMSVPAAIFAFFLNKADY